MGYSCKYCLQLCFPLNLVMYLSIDYSLSGDDKYSVRNSENLPQLFQIYLRKKKIFLCPFCSIFQIYVKFWTVWKNDNQYATGSQRLLKAGDGTFIKFLYNSERNGVRKHLSWWYEKSYDCLLTHSLPMISILLVIVRIYGNKFKCNYLRN